MKTKAVLIRNLSDKQVEDLQKFLIEKEINSLVIDDNTDYPNLIASMSDSLIKAYTELEKLMEKIKNLKKSPQRGA